MNIFDIPNQGRADLTFKIIFGC